MEDLGVEGENIKTNIQELGWEGVEWINLTQGTSGGLLGTW